MNDQEPTEADVIADLDYNNTDPAKDYVKKKIKRHKNKTGRKNSRARKVILASIAPIVKKAKSISELLTEDDQEENLRVIREAKNATHHVYDTELKQLVKVPDHKTRLAAVAMDLAYREGRPVERQITATGRFEDLQTLMERVRGTSIGRSLQKTVEGKEITPACPTPREKKVPVRAEELRLDRQVDLRRVAVGTPN